MEQISVASVARRTSKNGKPFLEVKTGDGRTLFVWNSVDDIESKLPAGGVATVEINHSKPQYPTIASVAGGVAVMANRSAGAQQTQREPSEPSVRDVFVLASYIKDLRVAGKTRDDAFVMARECVSDARGILSPRQPPDNIAKSVNDMAVRLNVDVNSPAWAKYLEFRFGTGWRTADLTPLLVDLQGAYDGEVSMSMTPDGRWIFNKKGTK